MCENEDVSQVEALKFLQTEVSTAVDHSNESEAEAFRELLAFLITVDVPERNGSLSPVGVIPDLREDPSERDLTGDVPPPTAEKYKQRTAVFDNIMAFISEDAKEPPDDLLDMMALDIAV